MSNGSGARNTNGTRSRLLTRARARVLTGQSLETDWSSTPTTCSHTECRVVKEQKPTPDPLSLIHTHTATHTNTDREK